MDMVLISICEIPELHHLQEVYFQFCSLFKKSVQQWALKFFVLFYLIFGMEYFQTSQTVGMCC